MSPIRRLLGRYLSRKNRNRPSDVEALRIDFKERYHAFKLLLSSNTKALDIMADMEQRLAGDHLFGMAFIRGACTAVSVNVFNMIKNLNTLSNDKYKELHDRFDVIQQKVDGLLVKDKDLKEQRLVIFLDSVNKEMAHSVGSKMANLGEIRNRLKLITPNGFVITAAAHDLFIRENDLRAEIDRHRQSADPDQIEGLYEMCAGIQQLIIRSKVPQKLRDAIMAAWTRLEAETGNRINLALRSSALGEDTRESSFAGQYRSILNIGKDSVLDAYKEILAGKYSIQAVTYRLNKGFRDEDVSMCVGCVKMVDAAAGGVAYSRNPVDTTDDSVFINAVPGLPKSVVDGSEPSDLFVASRKMPMKVIRSDIRPKPRKFECFPEEGIRRVELTGKERGKASINEEQVLKLAELAVKIEDHYKVPQDIEWAMTPDGSIHILQSRPMQKMRVEKNSARKTPVASGHVPLISEKGITASPGAGFGTVFCVQKRMDLLGFPKGAVLVTQQALPIWASLLNRASAVVTEQGGFAGHLANVAREFGVPALFGVPGAVDLLKDKTDITVDADGLAVYDGKVDSLLTKSETKTNLMHNSPIYNTLKKVSRHIVPLNLLDPDSADFKQGSCRTLHDITRFVHEKAVHEMFSFGKEHDFAERSGKQLYYNVPMQWWVLNLDDGFVHEVKGKYVKLKNICSIPMLAFWKGYVAIPWEGPPAVDGKGLMSVMFRSTMNPALTPGLKSKYADRNYFTISKHYCSLSTRLGYHFATMEAMVGDRITENYVSFQFKGGAADFDRRLKRVHFIRDILEENHFRVEIREDNLMARVEGHKKDFMVDRLKILGYLALHTRQLDMVMSNPASVGHYRLKIQSDILVILGSEPVSQVKA